MNFWDMLGSLKGPEFLLLYFFWFLVTWIPVMIIRSQAPRANGLTWLGLGLFLGLGVLRMIAGSTHGQHKWGFLFLMMLFGSFLYVIRINHSGGSGGHGGSCGGGCGSSSSGGTSDGGGCGSSCGGGGCGGCGGS